MSIMQTMKGITKTFLWLVSEEWNVMDHKLIRIIAGVIGFTVMALFWYFFLRNFMPF